MSSMINSVRKSKFSTLPRGVSLLFVLDINSGIFHFFLEPGCGMPRRRAKEFRGKLPTRSGANIPHLHTEDVEFHALVREWLVPKGLALSADSFLEARVHPETVVSITKALVSLLSSTRILEFKCLPAT